MTATTTEALGNQKQAEQEARTARVAREAGNKAVAAARPLLDRHPDLVSRAIVARVLAAEYKQAAKQVTTGRREGLLSDGASEAPGISVFFSRQGLENLRQAIEERGDRSPHLAHYAASMRPVDPEATIYELALPEGSYLAAEPQIQLYGYAEMRDGEVTRYQNPMLLASSGVIRIVGDHGEVWQNPAFQPDGTPKVADEPHADGLYDGR